MAFISGYDFDIFISYAHVDNIAFPGQADGWIQQFYMNLNLMLAKRSGRLDRVKIWWDSKKLDGSVVFNQSIAEGIQKSAIMICLYSPGYMQSPYCNKELDLFYKKAQAEKTGLKIGDRYRIINVLLNNISHNDWSEQLRGTSGFPFHDSTEKDNFGDPLETISYGFRNQMQNLRDAVWQLLTDFGQIQDGTKTEMEEQIEEDSDSFTIYLGEVADTLRTPRKRIISELEKKGYNIISGVPPPDEYTAHKEATLEAVKKSNLVVHLLDEYPGREVIGAPELYYPQEQTEIALLSDKSQIIWVPEEMQIANIEEPKHQKFISDLENGTATTKHYEFIKGTKSSLIQEVLDIAEQLKNKKKKEATLSSNLSVLLDTHFNDQIYALDLGKTLLQHQIQPFINPQEDDPRKNIELLGERIRQVKKLIFLYGNVSKDWVIERMSAALQLIITNNYPIEDFFIYMAPPHKEVSDISIAQRFLKVNVFDSSKTETPDKALLDQFISELKMVDV